VKHGSEVEVEFIVAGGGATEGFEPGEEIFDPVAFVIHMLVKGRFLAAVGMYGYDGGAALLVHISTEGIAVVAFVHDDSGARPHVVTHQRPGSMDVGDIGSGEDKSQGIIESIAGHVDLGDTLARDRPIAWAIGPPAGPAPCAWTRTAVLSDQHMLPVGLAAQSLMNRPP
jgi:hypothetical protein